jgi:hypothetical protein
MRMSLSSFGQQLQVRALPPMFDSRARVSQEFFSKKFVKIQFALLSQNFNSTQTFYMSYNINIHMVHKGMLYKKLNIEVCHISSPFYFLYFPFLVIIFSRD